MNVNEKEALIARLDGKPHNFDTICDIWEIYRDNPTIAASEANRKSGVSESAFYRIKKQLEDLGILGQNLTKRTYALPISIAEGKLPPADTAYWVHLAAYLAECPDNFPTQYKGRSKKEIVQELQHRFASVIPDEETFEFTDKLYNGLALSAILNNDLDAFKNMLGSIKPPEELPWEDYV